MYSADHKGKPNLMILRDREEVTVVECVSSKGITIPLLVMIKGKQKQASWYLTLRVLSN